MSKIYFSPNNGVFGDSRAPCSTVKRLFQKNCVYLVSVLLKSLFSKYICHQGNDFSHSLEKIGYFLKECCSFSPIYDKWYLWSLAAPLKWSLLVLWCPVQDANFYCPLKKTKIPVFLSFFTLLELFFFVYMIRNGQVLSF